MARRLVRIAAVLLVTAAVALGFRAAGCSHTASALQQTVGPSGKYAPVAEALSKFVQGEMEDKKLPAFSIALLDEQQVVWARGLGYADPDKKSPLVRKQSTASARSQSSLPISASCSLWNAGTSTWTHPSKSTCPTFTLITRFTKTLRIRKPGIH
jgi:CubicO group peptidase (beta-lactamase class C family)